MAIAFVCDVCQKPFRHENSYNNVSFAFKDFQGQYIRLDKDDDFSWDVCPECRDSILRHIELLSKAKNKEESE